MLKVESKYLLLIAAAVWIAAGANIVRLGIQACAEDPAPAWLLVLAAIAIFLLFHIMFTGLIKKHSDRIRGYEGARICAFRFFDLKGYIIMAVMMCGGMSLRTFGIVPSWFVAFFYTGLGVALMLAGIGFLVHFARYGGSITCPVTKRTRLA